MLNIAKNNSLEVFHLFRWVFYEIKNIDIKQRPLSSKMEVISNMSVGDMPHANVHAHPTGTGKEVVEGASTSALWTQREKKVMTNCLAKNMEATQREGDF